METIKSIDTIYKGYNFRSRTEARWAIFFDACGYKWHYEFEGFKLPSGAYLPDFYFPEFNTYAEVKGKCFTEEEINKCKELSMLPYLDIFGKKNCHQVLLLDGPPSFKSYEMYIGGEQMSDAIFIPKDRKFYPLFYGYDFDVEYFEETTECIVKALSHRFEFGGK